MNEPSQAQPHLGEAHDKWKLSPNARWGATCALLVIPLTAILHNAVFYWATCILNASGAMDYTFKSTLQWLSRDPSLPWAIAGAIGVYFIGRKVAWVKIAAMPFFIAFIPLSVWIWDIPFTGRYICYHFHDHRVTWFGWVFRSSQFYMLGCILFIVLFVRALWRKRAARRIIDQKGVEPSK